MKEIGISKFKATCVVVLERIRRTRKPIRITRYGQPIAEIFPPAQKPARKQWLGALAGTGKVVGDIVSPATDEKYWDVLG